MIVCVWILNDVDVLLSSIHSIPCQVWETSIGSVTRQFHICFLPFCSAHSLAEESACLLARLHVPSFFCVAQSQCWWYQGTNPQWRKDRRIWSAEFSTLATNDVNSELSSASSCHLQPKIETGDPAGFRWFSGQLSWVNLGKYAHISMCAQEWLQEFTITHSAGN